MRKVFLALLAGSLVASVATPAFSQDVNPSTGLPFYTDDAQIGSWAIPAVDQLQLEGILVGFPDGSFQPKATLTREEFAVALNKAMALLEQKVLQAAYESDAQLYNVLVEQQLQILEIADKQAMAKEVASGRNWVGLSIGASAVDNSDDVVVTLDGKIAVLDVAGMYVSVNPFVSTGAVGGASVMLNKELGDKLTLSAGGGAGIGWQDDTFLTDEAGTVEGFGQGQIEYDLSNNTGLYTNVRVPFTGDKKGDVTIQGGVKFNLN